MQVTNEQLWQIAVWISSVIDPEDIDFWIEDEDLSIFVSGFAATAYPVVDEVTITSDPKDIIVPKGFRDYQTLAAKTAIYPKEQGLTYVVLELASEAGEIAGKIKKIIRDRGSVVSSDDVEDLGGELGDVLWALAMLCQELGISLEAVAIYNLNKLASRQERGKLGGNGDDR